MYKAGKAALAVAAVFVREASIEGSMPLDAMARHYGLTPAETRVLFGVLNVGNIPEMVAVLGISENTIKSHLQRVFEIDLALVLDHQERRCDRQACAYKASDAPVAHQNHMVGELGDRKHLARGGRYRHRHVLPPTELQPQVHVLAQQLRREGRGPIEIDQRRRFVTGER